MLTRLLFLILWLLHWLPLSLQARLGHGLGWLLYTLGRERRHVTLTNLKLCFPDLSEAERICLAKATFAAFGRSFIERGLLWWGSAERIEKFTQVVGYQHLLDAQGDAKAPVILLAPHFVALDVGWSWLTRNMNLVSMYSNQKNPIFHQQLFKGRLRFGASQLYSRQQGLRPIIKAMQQGMPFYYLPDQDLGVKDGLFSPFFNIPAATLTAVPRLAGITQAKIIPFTTRMLPNAAGYELKFYPAWENYPSGDLVADTRKMNEFIEQAAATMPEQYFWLHKRFKTRPEGEAKLY